LEEAVDFGVALGCLAGNGVRLAVFELGERWALTLDLSLAKIGLGGGVVPLSIKYKAVATPPPMRMAIAKITPSNNFTKLDHLIAITSSNP
jgi:Na+/citrate or Na+/malate symporter